MRNYTLLLASLLVILALALGGCVQQAPQPAQPAAEEPAAEAPAAEAPAAEEPAAEEPAAEAPAAEAPAAEEPAAEAPAAEGEQFTVALVYGVKNDGFYITMERGAREMADKLGMEFLADGPEQFDATLQTPIVDAMIARGIDALLIAATDKQAMVEPMRRAHDAGIKVISVDTFIGDGDYVNGPETFPLSYVGSDNVLGGQIACQALIDDMGGSGKIYIQNVKPGVSTTDQRQQGCEQAIEATNGAVELVGVDFNDDNSSIAAEQTSAMLAKEPDLNAIFGTNLFSAQGAAQAVNNAGLAGVVKVANFDAPETAIEDLRNNLVDMVIAQKPADIGTVAVGYAYLALTGRESAIAKRVPTGYEVITRDNVDTPEAQGAIYKSSAEPAAPAEAEQFTAALVYGVKNDGFYITMERGAREMADKLGMEFLADGPEQFDATLQTPIVDAMIARGIDALLIAATDKQAMVEPMRRAHDAGIKVISVDTFIGDGDYVNGPETFPLSYVGSDNVLGGQIACQALIDDMGGSGKIYIQNVKPGVSTTDQRQQGCEQAIEATNGAVELVGVDFNDDNSSIAAEQTSAMLAKEPDLNAIFGTNLFSAQGAAQAVNNAGLAGVVKVANFDAPETAIEDLRNNLVDMVIAQKPADIGTVAVMYSYLALTGRESALAKRVPTGYEVITRDNVDTPEAQGAIYKSQ